MKPTIARAARAVKRKDLPGPGRACFNHGMAILLAGLSALMYGGADFCGGLATRRSTVLPVLVFSQLVGLLIAVGGAFVLGQPVPSPRDLAWGAVAGLCGTAGLAALYTAIATTPVAVASPIAAVSGAVIPVLLGVASGERPDTLAWVGIALAFPAILLLTMSPGGKGKDLAPARRAALLGLAAGVGFGLFFFAISRTGHASGLWPLASARVATITVTVVFALVRSRPLLPGGGWAVLLLSGALDMGANIAFLLASRLGMLSIAAVVAALYPGPTVFLACIVFRERLTLPRAAGLALALAGVALISV
jgi:drug/metabolite transporter (DMT)-like permease